MILVINAGSSNIKFAVYDEALTQMYRAQLSTIEQVFEWLSKNKTTYRITSIGHRIVHGGKKFFVPVLLNQKTIDELKSLTPLAPLHQPHNIAAVEYLMREYPNVPQVGCFDTAFHKTQLPLAKQFAIPKQLTDEGIIRYGFHGLSYEYVASILREKIGAIAQKKVIVAHLGNGASMCAMHNLQSVATTMGFSTLDGLMMGTRTGSIDPGVLLYLLQEKKYSVDEVSKLLYDQCGLFGVSGVSNDVKTLLNNDTVQARNAIDLFCFMAACEAGKLVTVLGGCDVLIFTGGIGQNAAPIRANIANWLMWLGAKLDFQANATNNDIISTAESKLLIGIVPTNEEYMIAQHTKQEVAHVG
ncbi:MAG TPA: acetate/propionate family kinase [Gammaproteobacteria bacterium]|nr:acetate/propionate family kinase [Gammaproteobacteria bacterium]